MGEKVALGPVDYAHLAVDIASDRLASDIVLLDVKTISDFADYFVLLTAESTRQLRDLAQEIEQGLEARGALLHHREGTPESGWMLLDFGNVIVDIFGPEERDYYRLEEAWSRGTALVRIQ